MVRKVFSLRNNAVKNAEPEKALNDEALREDD